MDLHNCSPLKWMENESNYLKLLEDDIVWNNIPLLNVNELHNFTDSSLVRFRGMIQDMHSPEYYLEKFEVISNKTKTKTYKNAKYCDAVFSNEGESVNFDSESNVTSERHTYVVVTVPGINEWAQLIEENQYRIEKSKLPCHNVKTKRTFDEVMDTSNLEEDVKIPSNSIKSPKNVCSQGKQSNVEETEIAQSIVSKEHILNFPLPNCSGKTCHLKIYKNQEELKLNDICEFVGFLGIDPLTEAAYQEKDEHENKMERETLHPPSSLIPRIHCVSFKRLKHNNPLILNDNVDIGINNFDILYEELLIVLTQLLLGDKLAAEYMICHLLSEVYIRTEILSLGKFCLNITNIPELKHFDYVSELYKFIEMLVPKSYYLAMTLENMNNLSFIPKKDYDCNRLTAGILQLSQNTHVILDETKLSPGKFNSSGINNVRALTEAIQYQRLTYDFNYYQLEFNCDIPFLILSEGKSLLGSDVHVVLKPEKICIDTFAEILEAANFFLKPELLSDIRKYLTLARLIKYEVSDEVEEMIQQEFVNMRQEANISANDLHSLLVLARLVSISMGKTSLDEDSWRKACELEKQRKARLVK